VLLLGAGGAARAIGHILTREKSQTDNIEPQAGIILGGRPGGPALPEL